MKYDEAVQIATAILHSSGPLISDQYGSSRRLASVIAIISSHTEGGQLWIEEDGKNATLRFQPDEAAKEEEENA